MGEDAKTMLGKRESTQERGKEDTHTHITRESLNSLLYLTYYAMQYSWRLTHYYYTHRCQWVSDGKLCVLTSLEANNPKFPHLMVKVPVGGQYYTKYQESE